MAAMRRFRRYLVGVPGNQGAPRYGDPGRIAHADHADRHVTFNHEIVTGAARAQAAGIATRLLDLESLHDRGLVTMQEYEAKKAEILSQR
ncbi:SHOCT domain-containing protein [Luteimonas mephitis]|uniref:SHOCT domain-containing protein n=1 Tax=Luteimonas mephitis TaxID=83615 RepID=UPI0012EBCA86|nr:SHOCT domain-containing protein [Luteimonas mephitis]